MKPSEYQKEIRTTKILKSLEPKPKGFKDIVRETNMHDMTVSREIKNLLRDEKIRKTIVFNKPVYELTVKGKDYLEVAWVLFFSLYEMKDKTSSYYTNCFSVGQEGIYYHLIKQVDSPYVDYKDDIKKTTTGLLKKILIMVRNCQIDQEKMTGKHIIAFEIDFDLIKKNIDLAKNTKEVNTKSDNGNIYSSIQTQIENTTKDFYRKVLGSEVKK